MDRFRPATPVRTPAAQAMLDAATQFGLTREEAWHTFNVALAAAPPDTDVPAYLDEIAGSLVREILEKQRRILREQRSEDVSIESS
jgi:hypothetical protein